MSQKKGQLNVLITKDILEEFKKKVLLSGIRNYNVVVEKLLVEWLKNEDK